VGRGRRRRRCCCAAALAWRPLHHCCQDRAASCHWLLATGCCGRQHRARGRGRAPALRPTRRRCCCRCLARWQRRRAPDQRTAGAQAGSSAGPGRPARTPVTQEGRQGWCACAQLGCSQAGGRTHRVCRIEVHAMGRNQRARGAPPLAAAAPRPILTPRTRSRSSVACWLHLRQAVTVPGARGLRSRPAGRGLQAPRCCSMGAGFQYEAGRWDRRPDRGPRFPPPCPPRPATKRAQRPIGPQHSALRKPPSHAVARCLVLHPCLRGTAVSGRSLTCSMTPSRS